MRNNPNPMWTIKEFAEKFYERWPDKLHFDFSNSKYLGNKESITFYDNRYDRYYTTTVSNLLRTGTCLDEINTISEFKFLSALTSNFPHYKLLENYKGPNTKILAFCEKHNVEFYLNPSAILENHIQCPKCISISRGQGFFKFLRESYPNIGFNEEDYVNSRTPLPCWCKIHPEEKFSLISSRLHSWRENRFGNCEYCTKCREIQYKEGRLNEIKLSIEKRYPNKFDLSKMTMLLPYETADGYHSRLFNIICKDCGNIINNVISNRFLQFGCLECNKLASGSIGETFIDTVLKELNFSFKRQVKVVSDQLRYGMKQTNSVIIDFTLEYKNEIYWIEYDGEQHYIADCLFHETIDDFQFQVDRDKGIENYCKLNNIKLIRIPYSLQKNIRDILIEVFIMEKDPTSLIKLPELNYEWKRNK